MSEETKERLVGLEQDTLGKGRRINAEELTEAITDTLAERIAALTDRDISFAAHTLHKDGDLMALRADGKFAATAREFKAMAEDFRDQCRNGDKEAREGLRLVVSDEVDDRLTLFSEATPDKFGGAKEKGVTPLQALLVTYSIISDDRLEGSQADLEKAATGLAKRTGRKAFGVNGFRFSTPVNLVFNRETTARLLDRLEKGGAQ
jgi:hypothetical protein